MDRYFRVGRGVYTCYCCHNRTRNVGDGSGVGLCEECYDVAGWFNSVQDGHEGAMENLTRAARVAMDKRGCTSCANDLLEAQELMQKRAAK